VVAVIVDDAHAANFAHLGEAPVNPAEAGQRVADLGGLQPQVPRHRHGGERVRDVVIPRHRQGTALDHRVLGLQRDVEMRHAALVGQVHRAHIGLRVEAEGDDAAVGDAAHQRLHLRVVGAADGKPVERDVGDEIEESPAGSRSCPNAPCARGRYW
jgi:hypothetical protein